MFVKGDNCDREGFLPGVVVAWVVVVESVVESVVVGGGVVIVVVDDDVGAVSVVVKYIVVESGPDWNVYKTRLLKSNAMFILLKNILVDAIKRCAIIL